MLSWIEYLSPIQAEIIRTLPAQVRAGGVFAFGLAFALGAIHALTPGHGKAALAAFFLGRDARMLEGLKVTLTAALLHVLSGFALFLVFRFVIGGAAMIMGRPSPSFVVAGYGLIVLAGCLMLLQSVKHRDIHGGTSALTAGVGLLPCPLTISVLGFAWTQGSAVMIAVMLLALALGIALTIGTVAIVAILIRSFVGDQLAGRMEWIESGSLWLQRVCAILIILFGLYPITTVLLQ